MKKLLLLLFTIVAVSFGVSCNKGRSYLGVTLDCGNDILTTDMTTNDLKQYLTVVLYKDINDPGGKKTEIDKYTVSCDFSEGNSYIEITYKDMTSRITAFFVDKSKLSYVDDFVFYTYKSDEYLLRYTGADSEITLLKRKPYYIFDGAFANNTTLKRVDLGNSVIKIGSEAFYGCTALERVDFGDGITEV